MTEPRSTLRDRWRAGATTVGAWLGIPSSATAEIAARVGFDYVCVDMQHGVADYADTVGMIQAISYGGASPLVRVPWNEPGIIGKVLDAGAEGVIVPMVNSVADAEAVVQAARYAPHGGARSWGPVLAAGRVDSHYLDWARDHIAVIVMIETAQALDALDEIVAVPGVDAVYVGPADLSVTLGLPPGNNDGEAAFDDALTRIAAAAARAGVVPAIHSQSAPLARRAALGYTMQTVANDSVILRQAMVAELERARSNGSDDAPTT